MSGAAATAARGLRIPRAALVLGAAGAVAAAGAWAILAPQTRVSTDNAYVQADITTLAPKIRGLVSDVLVHDNQPVRAGDVLVRIDAEEFTARLAVAQGDLAAARAARAAARASLAKLDAEQRLAAAQMRASAAMISGADAENHRAELDRTRYDYLAARGDASWRDADRARAQATAAAAEAERSRAALAVSTAQVDVTAGRRAELQAALAQADAAEQRAAGALALAQQDLAHATIRAPVDGVIGNRQVQPGDYVQPGSALMRLVPMNTLYVTANFKETQTARMRPGQPADVAIDAIGGDVLHAEVESMAPGSGAQFALLPFEPGTGNFTKIVQRVPVRLRLLQVEPRLRPGLSAVVTVRLE